MMSSLALFIKFDNCTSLKLFCHLHFSYSEFSEVTLTRIRNFVNVSWTWLSLLMGGIQTQPRTVVLFNLTFCLKFKSKRFILISLSQSSIWLKLSNKYFPVFHLSETFSKSLNNSKNIDKLNNYRNCTTYLQFYCKYFRTEISSKYYPYCDEYLFIDIIHIVKNISSQKWYIWW